MNLDIDKWGTFRVADLFPILQNGKAKQSDYHIKFSMQF